MSREVKGQQIFLSLKAVFQLPAPLDHFDCLLILKSIDCFYGVMLFFSLK